MQKALLKWLRKIVSDAHSAIVSVVFVSAFGGAGFFLWKFPNQILTVLMQNIPLWLSIATTLGAVLLCLVAFRILWNRKDDNRRILIKVGDFKWDVLPSRGSIAHFKEIPYCPKHECQLITSDHIQYFCPIDRCKIKVSNRYLEDNYQLHESLIEAKLRKRSYGP